MEHENINVHHIGQLVEKIDTYSYYGKVSKIAGLTVESIGP